tara:strand:- start:18719 stop:19108 length:390 start_codon:yes stop_codon:yes gene_type:complete
MLDIGSFDTKIKFQLGTSTYDAMGGSSYTWSTEFMEWAKVDFKDGKSSDNEERIQTTMSVEFTIRDTTAGTNKLTANNWRVLYPTNNGAVIANETQYYTVTGIYMWGGRRKYKTLITELDTNQDPISDL